MNHLFSIFLSWCRQNRLHLAVGLVLLFGLAAAVIIVETPAIEADIANRTQQTLLSRGLDRVAVNISGRDVTLYGAVSSESALSAARQYSESIHGARSVMSTLEISPLRLSYLVLSRNLNNELAVEGELPNQEIANQVADIAKSTISHSTFTNSVMVNPEVNDPDWLTELQGIFIEGDRLSGMEIEIGAGHLSLGGLLDHYTDYSVLISRINQFRSGLELRFVNKIGISPGIVGKEVPLVNEITEETISLNIDAQASVDSSSVLQNGDTPVQSHQSLADEIEITRVEGAETSKNVAISRSEIEQCQITLNSIIFIEPITFTPNSSEISVDNDTKLFNIASKISDCPTFDVKISGHTDSRGDEEKNLLLSKLRAQAVMEAIIRWGIAPTRISAQGFGSSYPIATNETDEGRNKNRRIEVTLVSE